jgi:uncharacterized membrane-anchored protein
MIQLPPNHPLRIELNNEVHARPPESLIAPCRLSYIALWSDYTMREKQWQAVSALTQRYGAVAPPVDATHYSAELGPFRLKWERHTEFVRYTFIVPGAPENPFSEPALLSVPQDWLATLPGQIIVASHAAAIPDGPNTQNFDVLGARLFGGSTLNGASVSSGSAKVLTDFYIHGDGFSRFLILDKGMTPRQAGRIIQRVLEIETYRVMALMALPVARELGPILSRCERELADTTRALIDAAEIDEPKLLEELTRLEAEIESKQSETVFRFTAAAAYYSLVQSRILELREERIHGLQTFGEFTERRLAPAMNTCQSTTNRHDALSQRVARATQLLSTRVDVNQERQNRALLESMNRRARLQLRLQETVEGLSIAAVTYYVVGLVGYLAKGLKGFGVDVNPDVAMGVSVPIVIFAVWLGVHSIRRMVSKERHEARQAVENQEFDT